MGLNYAPDQLFAALRKLSSREGPVSERLQAAWDENVQMLWMKPCLTRDLLAEFRDLWQHRIKRCVIPLTPTCRWVTRSFGGVVAGARQLRVLLLLGGPEHILALCGRVRRLGMTGRTGPTVLA